MKKVILVRYGEILLKGLNRPIFEDKLMSNIKRAIHKLGKVRITKSQARIYIEPLEENYDFDEALKLLSKVFGIVSVSTVWKIDSDFECIKENSVKMVKDLINREGYKTFKVETKRGNKRFPMDSPEISRQLGGYILRNVPELSVDVKNPDFILYVEVREFTYIYSEIIQAVCGMPLGSNGKAVLLLSGGIDSPVAGWMIAKRGVEIEAVHFYSYPYTSERAKEKVIELTKILATYCQKINLHIVPFTEIQLEINEKCPHEELTIIMRRAMMRIAEIIANKTGALALVTGESVGQVASQTIQSLVVTNAVVSLPVFRPLIGMDKNEVVDIAKKIGTFETSILPYEDCCTVFVAKHPTTKPKLERIQLSESRLNMEELINKAVENTEVLTITRD
ncbi:thiamine biosynthesis protein ThiI [Acetivibrio thermocellus AD2]|jgi:thiamine biosynthesis protein ThiI|uniref:Probable tRNA sulfurtransferase n=1 Tax=Acetivibrio thermocellus AD2 TaxID=1138384 RepID=A0AB36TEU0_ACETH|nr:tRNA uracil 4-sulfurtransferase ThiI [Acetivibrio thermocellus]ADU74215.1 thiamine biosynthesis/tRNA modification protein ThiI [Acetivibrio thermocellus DSM 1313]ALX08158.1 tRNA sulfurtransferase [Acetivibrio thermocellus AD2]ANV75905.1 tRNA sulfurtransferase [Acetivibrio thermocellus DSM 2360]EIC05908.1 tRNA sulfurtransferase [Acetivibrio thermocellus YS]PFH02429.1 thiamine biosynthesis protein ThiI [Acetivibrio thermocellus AD2]